MTDEQESSTGVADALTRSAEMVGTALGTATRVASNTMDAAGQPLPGLQIRRRRRARASRAQQGPSSRAPPSRGELSVAGQARREAGDAGREGCRAQSEEGRGRKTAAKKTAPRKAASARKGASARKAAPAKKRSAKSRPKTGRSGMKKATRAVARKAKSARRK